MDDHLKRLLIAVLGLLSLVMLCRSICGQSVERIACVTKESDVRQGTACCVCRQDGKTYWLTCWHVVEDSIAIAICEQRGELLAHSKVDDLAVIVSGDITDATAWKLGRDLSGKVSLSGYGPKGKLRMWQSNVLANVDVEGMAMLDAPSQRGDSGGPVVSRGNLCGLIHASDSKNISIVIRPKAIRKLLKAAGFGLNDVSCKDGTCLNP